MNVELPDESGEVEEKGVEFLEESSYLLREY